MILKEFSEKSYLIKEKEEPKGEREKKMSPLSCLSLCFSFPPSLSSLLSSVCVCVYKVNFLLLRVILKKKGIFSQSSPPEFFLVEQKKSYNLLNKKFGLKEKKENV